MYLVFLSLGSSRPTRRWGGQTKRDQAKYSCNPRLTRAYLWLHLSVIQLIRACPDPQRSHLKIQSLLPLYQLYLPECFNCISLNVSTVFLSMYQLYFSQCINCIFLKDPTQDKISSASSSHCATAAPREKICFWEALKIQKSER